MNLEPYQRSTLQERNSRIYKETNKKMTSSEKFTYKDIRQQIDQQFIEQGWITVSDSDIYSALIPDSYLEKSLKTEYWDITEYSPQLWASCNRDNPTYEYKRYENGIEPLVILRDSRGKYPSGLDKEGIVIRPCEPEYCRILGKSLSFKVLNNDFLAKEK